MEHLKKLFPNAPRAFEEKAPIIPIDYSNTHLKIIFFFEFLSLSVIIILLLRFLEVEAIIFKLTNGASLKSTCKIYSIFADEIIYLI